MISLSSVLQDMFLVAIRHNGHWTSPVQEAFSATQGGRRQLVWYYTPTTNAGRSIPRTLGWSLRKELAYIDNELETAEAIGGEITVHCLMEERDRILAELKEVSK